MRASLRLNEVPATPPSFCGGSPPPPPMVESDTITSPWIAPARISSCGTIFCCWCRCRRLLPPEEEDEGVALCRDLLDLLGGGAGGGPDGADGRGSSGGGGARSGIVVLLIAISTKNWTISVAHWTSTRVRQRCKLLWGKCFRYLIFLENYIFILYGKIAR
jgi:hypothetical protein